MVRLALSIVVLLFITIGMVPFSPGHENVALKARGARVSGASTFSWQDAPEVVIDGIATGYDRDRGYAYADLLSPITITLERAYPIEEIRFLLWDLDDRYYGYSVELSPDGSRFETLADRRRERSRGWQSFRFPTRPVRAIRITGTANSVGQDTIHLVEVEAYTPTPTVRPGQGLDQEEQAVLEALRRYLQSR